ERNSPSPRSSTSARDRRRAHALRGLCAISLLLVGCATASEREFAGHASTSAAGGAGGTTGVGGSGPPTTGSGGDIGPVGVTTGAGGAGVASCSADLQSVLNGDGTVKETCPSDKGCFDGQCIPACEAAGLSKGTIGCDFFDAVPPPYSPVLAGQCY